jgi:hypothetical protein
MVLGHRVNYFSRIFASLDVLEFHYFGCFADMNAFYLTIICMLPCHIQRVTYICMNIMRYRYVY